MAIPCFGEKDEKNSILAEHFHLKIYYCFHVTLACHICLGKYNKRMDTESLAALFKTLSEPVRLRIVYLLLEKGELCVCDLVDTLEISQSVVSRHLAYLRNNNLVSTRREGVWVYYRITECCCEPLFEYIRQSGEKNPEMQADITRLQAVSQQDKCG